MYKISKKQAIDTLEYAAKFGARPITLTLVSHKKLLKKSRVTGEPQALPSVRKITTINGIINFNYTKSVNKQREKSGLPTDFVAQSSFFKYEADGEINKVIVCKKDDETKKYIRMKPEKVLAVTFTDEAGNILEEDAIKDYLPENKSLEGLSNCATISLENVKAFTINKENYEICD